jgi:hypothetical protein
VIGTIDILCATREAGVVRARTARAGHALLGLRAGCVETRQQTLAINADARVAALEVELAAEGRRVGIVFERVETKTVVRAGRSQGTLVLFRALADAAEGRADFPDGAVGGRNAQVPLWRRLWVALVPPAQEAATIAEWAVRNADVARVVVAASEAKERDDENPEAFHRRFDAPARGIFSGGICLKINEFHRITGAK